MLYAPNGNFLTRAIFFETSDKSNREQYAPLYTLKLKDIEVDGIGKLESAYRIFMESTDEYEAAIELVGNLSNWEKLCNLKWFMEGGIPPAESHIGLDTWRSHKSLKDKSAAKKLLVQAAEEGNVTAQKKLFEIEEKDKSSSKKQKSSKARTSDSTITSIASRMKGK